MVTTADEPETPVTRSQALQAEIEAAARLVIAGSEVGAVRRIVLYLVAVSMVMVLSVGANDWWALIPGLIGCAALGLLMGTDELR